MKGKRLITKENYKEIMLKRGIISCWVLLGICLAIKLLGGNFFKIACNNETFISFCNFMDDSVLRFIIYYITFIYTSLMLIMSVEPKIKFKSKKILLYLFVITIVWILKLLIELDILPVNVIVYNIGVCVVLYFVLLLFSKRPLLSLIIVIYDFVLALASAIVKDIGLSGAITDSFMIDTLFLIDYYILLTLTMLYRKKKILKEV